MLVPMSFASAVQDPEAFFGTPPAEHHLPAYAEGDDSPSFKDVLDTINPLQHLPIISTIYRELTGDQPGAVSRVLGGALYGGPIGLAYEMVNSAIDDQTGMDVGGHTWAMLFDDTPEDQAIKVADAANGAASATAPQQVAAALGAPAGTAIDAAATSTIVAQAPAPLVQGSASLAASPTVDAASPVAQAPKALSPKLLASADGPQPIATNAVASSQLPPGYLPAPARRTIQVNPLPPTGGATLSTNNARSFVPAAGHPIVSTAQTDARGVALSQPGNAPVPVQPAVSPPPPATPNAWLPNAMSNAMDKYERMQKLGQNVPAAAAPAVQLAP